MADYFPLVVDAANAAISELPAGQNLNLANSGIVANGSVGTSGQVLASNGTVVYWTTPNPGDITGVTAGNGLSGGGNSGAVTISAVGNTGIVANTSGLHVNSAHIATLASNSATYANSSVSNTFTVGTSAYFVSNGNFGINQSAPTSKLDINGGSAYNIVAVAASAIDCSLGNFFTKTATGALSWTFTNVPSTRAFVVALELTNGGAGTQTWPASVKWPGGIAPTLTASGVDMLVFITDDGGTTWRGVASMTDSK